MEAEQATAARLIERPAAQLKKERSARQQACESGRAGAGGKQFPHAASERTSNRGLSGSLGLRQSRDLLRAPRVAGTSRQIKTQPRRGAGCPLRQTAIRTQKCARRKAPGRRVAVQLWRCQRASAGGSAVEQLRSLCPWDFGKPQGLPECCGARRHRGECGRAGSRFAGLVANVTASCQATAAAGAKAQAATGRSSGGARRERSRRSPQPLPGESQGRELRSSKTPRPSASGSV